METVMYENAAVVWMMHRQKRSPGLYWRVCVCLYGTSSEQYCTQSGAASRQ